MRQATIDDLARMGELAAAFYDSSRFLRGFRLERFTAFWSQLLGGAGVIFVDESADGAITGAIGGLAYPEPYSGELVATEFFWFVLPGARGGGLRLYRAFEAWASERGCSQLRMVHLEDSMPDRLATVYTRLGFIAAERHFVKELG